MNNKISISLFFSCIVICLCIGIVIGLSMNEFMYEHKEISVSEGNEKKDSNNDDFVQKTESVIIHEPSVEVTNSDDIITADTKYVLLEKDLDTGYITKVTEKIPSKYIGLNREQLIEHLADYDINPPLAELERGFINIELISFSPSQIQVQRNYQYMKPTESFYIVVYNHNVVVMLEDKKTIYLDTQIKISELPYEVQQDIMKGLFIPNEESLYAFLENYTS